MKNLTILTLMLAAACGGSQKSSGGGGTPPPPHIGAATNQLFFSAGPFSEAHGLVGRLDAH